MLNDRQRQAVHYVQGPLLVLAGAGSGKTRVITEKIAYLIRENIYTARQIAAVTFTNKAAREMRERVNQTMGAGGARGLTVSTFHTLGLNIIRRELSALGLKPGFSLFDDQDTYALLNGLTEDAWEGDKAVIQKCQHRIGQWKNAMISPEQALQEASTEDDRQFCYGLCAIRETLAGMQCSGFR